MVIAYTASPSPPHGATEASSPAPRAAAAVDTAAGVVGELEVVMGHPTFHAPDDIPLDEAVSTAHRALSQTQRVLRRDDEDLTDEHRHLQPPCSRRQQPLRGRRRGHGSTTSTSKCRSLTNATLTPSEQLPTRRSCTLQTRPGLAPSSSRRTSSRARARSTSRREMWRSWRGSCWSGRSWTTSRSVASLRS
jgi:hypothetical protein